jgi:hypothetical protein
MTIMGVSAWRFVLSVIAAEAIPILLLVLAMFFVGTKIGARPSQATAEAWGSWIGPIGGTLATAVIAWLLARSNIRPLHVGIALGVAVGVLDLSLTLLAAKGAPFRLLFAVSALARVVGGALGGFMAGRSATPGG